MWKQCGVNFVRRETRPQSTESDGTAGTAEIWWQAAATKRCTAVGVKGTVHEERTFQPTRPARFDLQIQQSFCGTGRFGSMAMLSSSLVITIAIPYSCTRNIYIRRPALYQLPPSLVGMSRPSRLDFAVLAPTSFASVPAAPLLHLPAAVFHLVFRLLPWYDQLLHVGHVHRRLPLQALVWGESDHVRLSEALVVALDQQRESAVRCARYVQSVYVDREAEDALLERDQLVPFKKDDALLTAALLRSTHLACCLRQLQLATAASQSSFPAPFQSICCLAAPPTVFQCLLDCSGLPHLQSLSMRPSFHVIYKGRIAEQQMLDAYLFTRPPLRRLRVEAFAVTYSALLALPCVEHVDVRHVTVRDMDAPIAPAPASLRCLLSGFRNMTSGHHLAAALASSTLQQLSITTFRPAIDMRAVPPLASLTVLDLQDFPMEKPESLACLVSRGDGAPMLPNLQRLSLRSFQRYSHYMSTHTAIAILLAYGHQLRSLALQLAVNDKDFLGPVFTTIVSSMTPLVSLELELRLPEIELEHGCRDVLNDIGPEGGFTSKPHQPALPALRSLTLRNLLMSDAAVAQLLACCPRLLELTLDGVGPLTAAVWSSLLVCQQLQSFVFQAASLMAPEADSIAGVSSFVFSVPRPSAAAFPSLSHVSLRLGSHVATRRLLSLFHLLVGSPIKAVALALPNDRAEYHNYLRPLASLPHLSQLLLEEGVYTTLGNQTLAPVDSVVRLLEQCSRPLHTTHEQHHTRMQQYWSGSQLGENEREPRGGYAAGVKTRWQGSRNRSGPQGRNTGWRVFERAMSEGQTDGRAAFFRALDSNQKRGASTGLICLPGAVLQPAVITH